MVKMPRQIGADHKPVGEALNEIDPFRPNQPLRHDNVIESDPRDIHMELRVGCQQHLNHLVVVLVKNPPRQSAMRPHHAQVRMALQYLPQLVQINIVIVPPYRRAVLVQ